MSDLGEVLVSEEEGRDPHYYPDNLGFASIGIGACIDRRVPGAGLCDAAIETQFAHDSAAARVDASEFPHFDELSDVRKAVVFSMAFQMGTKPLHWPNFMAAMQARDYKAAAAAGLDSDWYRKETPKRAAREMAMLEGDTWIAKT
jgi:GH24 family phage-related lysozyme (muramidase)